MLTNLEVRAPLHHLQNDVAANGMTHENQVGFSGNMSSDKGQLVFNLPIQAKHIPVFCRGQVWTKAVEERDVKQTYSGEPQPQQ